MKWYVALLSGLIFSVFFVFISTINLESTGIEYDEVFQAVSSFLYLDKNPPMFKVATINKTPILTMTYVGAIKSIIYGLYLKYVSRSFSIVSWRLLGILTTSAGILAFCLLSRKKLTFPALTIFLFFITSDITIILSSRHDYGPSSIALLIRLLFLATLLGINAKRISPIRTFFLGFLGGLALYEKLTSVFIFIPLSLVLILLTKSKKPFFPLIALCLGSVLGMAPLIFVNFQSYFDHGTLVSFTANGHFVEDISLKLLPNFFYHYFSLGGGNDLEAQIIGGQPFRIISVIEFMSIIVLLLMTIFGRHYRQKDTSSDSILTITILSYLLIGLGLYFFPYETSLHHWIIGTPFQYLAITFGFISLFSSRRSPALTKTGKKIFLLVLFLIFNVRIYHLWAVTNLLAQGKTSLEWDQSLTKVANFATSKTNDQTLFIAADWGLATQIYCLSNGAPNLVYELFWSEEEAKMTESILRNSQKQIIYLLTRKNQEAIFPLRTALILNIIENSKDWKEIPSEKEVTNLRAVQVRTFISAKGGSGTPN